MKVFLFTLVSFRLMVMTKSDCSCSDFVESASGFGNCQKIEFHIGGPICYVNEPSNCSDLTLSTRMARNYSSEACKNVPGSCRYGEKDRFSVKFHNLDKSPINIKVYDRNWTGQLVKLKVEPESEYSHEDFFAKYFFFERSDTNESLQASANGITADFFEGCRFKAKAGAHIIVNILRDDGYIYITRIVIIFLSLFSIFTICGNLFVILSVLLKDQLRRVRSNMFIISLATTDLLVGVICMPFIVSKLANRNEGEWSNLKWPHSQGSCMIWLFSDLVACTASIWNLVIIAFDRFLAVHKPITYMSLRRRSAGVMIFVAWFIGVLTISPVFIQEFVYRSHLPTNESSAPLHGINFEECRTENLDTIIPGLNILNTIINFWIPIIVIGICYSFVFIKIKQKIDKKIEAKMEQLEMMTCSTRMINQEIVSRGSSYKGVTNDNSRKTSATIVPITPDFASRKSRALSAPYLSPPLSPMYDKRRNNSSDNDHTVATFHKFPVPNQRFGKNDSFGNSSSTINELFPLHNGESEKLNAQRKTSFSYMNDKTGVPTVLPTAPTVNTVFKRERRVLIQMVVLIVIYLLFWMPFWTLYTWFFACIEIYYKHIPLGLKPSPSNVCKDLGTMDHVGHYLQYLGYMNSLINPFIYTGFNQEFRNLFRNILTYINISFTRCLSYARLNKIPADLL